jgi:hypothetical protein
MVFCHAIRTGEEMVTITVPGVPADRPRWATLERTLIDRMNDAIEPLLADYVHDDGRVMWPPGDDYVGMDAVDDVYEGFWNWPLFYALGGDREVFEEAFREFETITEQFADVPTGLGHPQIVNEYQQGHDWFHQCEGNLLFYHLCMAAPEDDRLRELATHFAGFYLNEHDDAPDNYDFEHDLLYCPMNGSMGPAYHNFSEEIPPAMYHAHSETRIPWDYEEWKERYGLPFYDLDGIDRLEDLKDSEAAQRVGEALRDRCARSDTPQNLGATGLLANAFLVTGEERYREWVSRYVGAWMERTERNGGVMPDNVDHQDRIGGNLDGRWYGGWYGWTWPHGWRSLGRALVGAAETARLLTGDESFLDLPRSQLNHLLERSIEQDGDVYLPYKRGDPADHAYDPDDSVLREPDGSVLKRDGWFEFDRQQASVPTHLWYASMAEGDRDRLEQLTTPSSDPSKAGKQSGDNDAAWAAYVAGDRPEYPEALLEADLAHVDDRLAFMESDDQDPATYGDWYLQERNPVVTEALVQLTTGAPQAIYNGGLSVATIRHFDPVAERPGLPDSVAALVRNIEPNRVTLDLVNTAEAARDVLVQAGGYGEHSFGTVRTGALGGDRFDGDEHVVDGDTVRVALDPAAGTGLSMELERYVNAPAYTFPWNRAP